MSRVDRHCPEVLFAAVFACGAFRVLRTRAAAAAAAVSPDNVRACCASAPHTEPAEVIPFARMRLAIVDPSGGDSAASLGRAPLPSGAPTLSGRSGDMCGCGHERGWHGSVGELVPCGSGPCTYGSGTAMGGCDCDRFHSRRRGRSSSSSSSSTNGAAVTRPGAKDGSPACAEALLAVLVQRTKAGLRTTRQQLAVLSGYSSTSSTFDASLARLRRTGAADGAPDALSATDGALQLRAVAPLPQGAALLELWASKLDKAPATLLRALAGARGYQATRAELAEVADYSTTSSTFDAALATIRRLYLVDRPTKDLYRLRPELRHEASA